MGEEMILFSMNAIRSMEVIDIKTGVKLGYAKDFKVDIEEQKIISIIIPPPSKSWFSREEDIEVSWERVIRAGVDVILIDGVDLNLDFAENNI